MFVDGGKHSGVISVTGNAIKRMISRDRVGTGGPAVAETPPSGSENRYSAESAAAPVLNFILSSHSPSCFCCTV